MKSDQGSVSLNQGTLIQTIAIEMLTIIGREDWDSLVGQATCLASESSFGLVRVIGNSEEPHRQSLLNRDERVHFNQISDSYKQLRQIMFTPGAGTWFSFTLTITRPQSVDVKFVYDEYPADEMQWVSPQMFVRDFDKFPRDAAHTPAWLKAKLAEGGRLLNGGLEEDIKDGRWKLFDSLGASGQIRPTDAVSWQGGPESYAIVAPPNQLYGVVFSDGLSDPDPVPGQPEGRGREMYLASQGFVGGAATGWLVDVLRGVCNQIGVDMRYGARFDVSCPSAPPDWATNGVVSVGVDVDVPIVPDAIEQPNGLIQLIGVVLLRPSEVPLIDPAARSDRSEFLARLRALPPEQITSLTRTSLA